MTFSPSDAAVVYLAMQEAQRVMNQQRPLLKRYGIERDLATTEHAFMELSKAQDLLWQEFAK